jgi:CubicO group peptidase (beta-lactamase class C family)
MAQVFKCWIALLLVFPAPAAGMPRLRSLLVSQRGTLVLERYFHGMQATTLANIKSASESVISALVGIAIERKLIAGVTTPIAPYFLDQLGSGADPAKRKISIEDLLTMRSGLESTDDQPHAWLTRYPLM